MSLYGKRVQRKSQQGLDPQDRPEGRVIRAVGGEVLVRWDKWTDAVIDTWENPEGLVKS